MTDFSFTVQGRAVGKQRPRVTRAGHTYTPSKTHDYEHIEIPFAIGQAMADREEVFFAGAVQVTADVYLYGKAVPDLDNILKSLLDGMNGVLYLDDKQVAAIHARRLSCPKAEQRVEVNVKELW